MGKGTPKMCPLCKEYREHSAIFAPFSTKFETKTSKSTQTADDLSVDFGNFVPLSLRTRAIKVHFGNMNP